jgi:hypothetical protein
MIVMELQGNNDGKTENKLKEGSGAVVYCASQSVEFENLLMRGKA